MLPTSWTGNEVMWSLKLPFGRHGRRSIPLTGFCLMWLAGFACRQAAYTQGLRARPPIKKVPLNLVFV
jgi:hypothetical protein